MNNNQRRIAELIPHKTLYTGEKIPAIGMGTFGSDRFSAEQISQAVLGAVRFGYRLFDCASVYENEAMIGDVLLQARNEGIMREELFIQSKIWNDMHRPGDVLLSCAKTLKDLKLDYLDMLFIHWPFRNHHAPGAKVSDRDEQSHAYVHEEFMETWRQMERLQKSGLVRHIGTSNMSIAKMKLLLRDCEIRPAANEMELHPSFQQEEFFRFCVDNQIQPVGFSPIGSPSRPDRDRTDNDYVDLEDPLVVDIAKTHGVHPAIVCIKWAIQRGQIPIPFSIHEKEYKSNLLSVLSDPLSPKEMELLKSVNRNCRLIKGQVFLWDDIDDWRILWDEDGIIRSR